MYGDYSKIFLLLKDILFQMQDQYQYQYEKQYQYQDQDQHQYQDQHQKQHAELDSKASQYLNEREYEKNYMQIKYSGNSINHIDI
ncbi:hypothetical protein [Clostridium sp.]|uniref:hypothetical protein n=1 Tax=Clostridium sp. TaxID=1506 RepID=UPI003464D272